jgi:hypothetical protein
MYDRDKFIKEAIEMGPTKVAEGLRQAIEALDGLVLMECSPETGLQENGRDLSTMGAALDKAYMDKLYNKTAERLTPEEAADLTEELLAMYKKSVLRLTEGASKWLAIPQSRVMSTLGYHDVD